MNNLLIKFELGNQSRSDATRLLNADRCSGPHSQICATKTLISLFL